MQGFFEFLKANPYILLFFTVGMAVWRRQVHGQGLRPRHGRRGGGRRRGTRDLGFDLRREAAARQLRQVALLLPVHVWRGPARRPLVLQQPEEGRHHLHHPGGDLLGAGPGAGGGHVRRLFDLPPGAAGGILAGSQTMSAAIGTADMAVAQGAYKIAGRQHRRIGLGHDRARLRRDLHLGHRRHHPDLQVPAALVGRGREKAAHEYEAENGVKNVDDTGLTGYRAGGLRAYSRRKPEHRRPDASRSSARRTRSTGSSMSCAATRRWRGPGDRAAARRRRRARRAARGSDRQHGPDRPGGRRRRGAQHPARPGRDPGHQQGVWTARRSRTFRNEDFAGQVGGRAASSAAANRSRSAPRPRSSASTCSTSPA